MGRDGRGDNITDFITPGMSQQIVLHSELENAIGELRHAALAEGIASFAAILITDAGQPVMAFDVSGYDHLKLMACLDFANDHIKEKVQITKRPAKEYEGDE